MENLRPNGQRAKNAVLLIWIVLALEVASLISGYFQYDLLQNVANGGDISFEAANANDLREQIIAIVYMIVYIISNITFILWFRRAYFNLHLKVKVLSNSEGWAAGAWFVPIVSLYKPYYIMKEMYQETKELLTKKGLISAENSPQSAVGWWWTLWIISNVIGQFVFRYSMKAETIDELTISTVSSMIGNIVGIPLALVTIKVIKDYANMEPLLNEVKDADGKTKDDPEKTANNIGIPASGDINPVQIFAGTVWQAGMVKSLLENAEIEAFVKDETVGTMVPWVSSAGGVAPVKVFVSSADHEKAKLVVEEYEKNLREENKQ